MSPINLDFRDQTTGQTISPPSDVLQYVKQGSEVLRRWLDAVDADVSAVWHIYEDHGSAGRSVCLTLAYRGMTLTRRLWVNGPAGPTALKEAIGELAGQFGRQLSQVVKVELRKLRDDFREFQTVGD